MRLSKAGETRPLSRRRRRRVRDLPIIPCWPPHFGRRTRPAPVSLKRLAAPRRVFILGMVPLYLCAETGVPLVPKRSLRLSRLGPPRAAFSAQALAAQGNRGRVYSIRPLSVARFLWRRFRFPIDFSSSVHRQ